MRTTRPKLGPIACPGRLGQMARLAGQGQRDPVPEGREAPAGEADHAQHEPVLRGAGGQARALDSRRRAGGSASGASARSSRSSSPTASGCWSRTCTRRAFRATAASRRPSCGRAVKFIDRQAETEETVDRRRRLQHRARVSPMLQRADDAARRALLAAPARARTTSSSAAASCAARSRRRCATWADDERTLDGKLLSDHAPVELVVPDPPPPRAARSRRAEPDATPRLPSLEEAQRAAPLSAAGASARAGRAAPAAEPHASSAIPSSRAEPVEPAS